MSCVHDKKLSRITVYPYSKKELSTGIREPFRRNKIRYKDCLCCIKCLKYFKGGWRC